MSQVRILDIDDADHYIDLRADGAIVYQSIFKRDFRGNFNLLISCIEDNIVQTSIDWGGVRRDYAYVMGL